MNIIEAQAHAKGYSDGYKAAESKMDELLKDKQRLDWILNSYTLSCGITREEIDASMAEFDAKHRCLAYLSNRNTDII